MQRPSLTVAVSPPPYATSYLKNGAPFSAARHIALGLMSAPAPSKARIVGEAKEYEGSRNRY